MINENNLSAVDKHKHLGIWIESSLRWDAHINYIVGKANRVLGLIRRTFGSKDPVPINGYSDIYYIHFEITGYPCNLIGSQQCDLFLNRTIFCSKSHLIQIASFTF